MSLSVDKRDSKIFKRRLTSLDTSTKITNISNKFRGSQLNYSKILLPSINSSLSRKTILEPESLMSKFLGNYRPKFSSKTQNDSSVISSLSKIDEIKSNRRTIIIKSKFLNNMIIPQRKENKYNSQRVFITEKEKDKFNLMKNKIRNSSSNNLLGKIKENLLENEFYIKSKEQPINIIDNNQSVQNMNNDNYNTIINENKKNKTRNKFNNDNKLLTNSSSNSSSLISSNYVFNTNYQRLRKFDNILENKVKKNNELKKSNTLDYSDIMKEKKYIRRIYENNIKFQSTIFEEQIRLLEEYYKEYKNNYLDINFIEIFKSKPLNSKIKFNITLEETCSILYYLPKLFLSEWYNLMINIVEIKIPNHKKFISDYITDENETVKNNNLLLSEVIAYFNQCVEFYMILSKKENETFDLKFTQYNFFKIVKYIKIARYNLIFLNNSYINSKKKFLDDLTLIKKFLIRNNSNDIKNVTNISTFAKKILGNNLLKENEKNKNINAIEKIEKQFNFELSEENKKKKRIDTALEINQRKSIYNYLGKEVHMNKKNIYKSIFLNKHMNKILNYCYDDVKNKIITEKFNDQEDIKKIKHIEEKQQAIKSKYKLYK